ncbi:MAG: M15 family metallopeptidase [Candidatus Saccharimonadales bacterium]
MRPPIKQTKTRSHFPLVIGLIVLLGLVSWYFVERAASPNSDPNNPDAESAAFDRELYSLDEPGSLWFIVNKQRPLPESYVPHLTTPDIPLYGPSDAENMQVDSRITDHLKALVASATSEGLQLALGSAYRSASYQSGIYNLYVEREGQTAADTFSARPGHSEHQSGLAVDFVRRDGECFIEACFDETAEGQWLAAHAHEYGFILRYREGMADITGYSYEPWHFRYVGTELARELHRQDNPTLEEFFDLPPASTY